MLLVNSTYNFATLAPSILGANYSGMKLISIMSSDTAIKYSDVYTVHESVRQVVTGLPVSPIGLIFYLFTDSNNNTIAIAMDYIDPNSIVTVTISNYLIEVFNETNITIDVLRLRLRELGIKNFRVTQS